MLDQRRAQERGYITLKQAAKIANYTPDYVGQLIRGGKIKGEQVYANVAWVTTEEEIQAYIDNKSRTVSTPTVSIPVPVQKLSKFFLYFLIGICVIALLFMQYILYVSIDAGINQVYLSKAATVHLPEEASMLSSR